MYKTFDCFVLLNCCDIHCFVHSTLRVLLIVVSNNYFSTLFANHYAISIYTRFVRQRVLSTKFEAKFVKLS